MEGHTVDTNIFKSSWYYSRQGHHFTLTLCVGGQVPGWGGTSPIVGGDPGVLLRKVFLIIHTEKVILV